MAQLAAPVALHSRALGCYHQRLRASILLRLLDAFILVGKDRLYAGPRLRSTSYFSESSFRAPRIIAVDGLANTPQRPADAVHPQDDFSLVLPKFQLH